MPDTLLIGDIHGQFAPFCRLLQGAGLMDDAFAWTGGTDHLWLMGDFFDHGPDGLAALTLVMRLQREAAEAGDLVGALLGNHDVLMLAAHRFGGPFLERWHDKGGVESDLEGLEPPHIAWLEGLPGMVLVDDNLLLHADAPFYLELGRTVDEVNRSLSSLVKSEDAAAFGRLLEAFGKHNAFRDDGRTARAFLGTYGGARIVHAHTPISKGRDIDAKTVAGAEVYLDGLCVNVDGGIYRGGPGFVFRL